MLTPVTLQTFPGLDLRDDAQEGRGAADSLNVELDQMGRLRSRDGYSKVTAAAGATRYDSVFPVATAASVSSSMKLAGTGADDATVGTLAWSSTSNITTDDGSYATVTGTNATSHYLKATNFGFAVPGTATIVGIVAEVQHKSSMAHGPLQDSSIKLVKGGVISGNNKSVGAGWSSVDSERIYGSSSDLWGVTLTPGDVNAATFGMGLSAVFGATTETASVDYIKITVYYQPLANLAVAGAATSRLDVIATDGTVTATVATATDTQSSYVAFGSPSTSAVYIANSGTTIRKLVGTTFSTPGAMPKAKFVGLQSPGNRLVAANVATIPTGAGSTASTSLVHFSDALAPETWSPNNYVYLTPGDNEDIQGLVTWRNNVYVFKSSRFFRFYGNTEDTTGQPIFNYREVSGAGLAAALGLAASPDGIYFLDRRGIYFTTGGPPQRISDTVAPLFQGGAQAAYLGGIINPSAIGQASMAWFNDRLYVGLPLGSATTNDHTLVYDPQTRAWTLWDIPMGAMAATASQPSRLLFSYAQGTFDIGQYAQNAYIDDAGTAISSRYRTGFLDLGTPEVEKTTREIILDGTGTVTLRAAVDDEAALGTEESVALGTSPAVAQGRSRTAGNVRCRNVSVDISATSAWSLSRMTFNVRGQRGAGEKST